jgi:hypothetical protein
MGVDNAGGTSYVSVIPHLLAGNAIPYTTPPGGVFYYFPLYIRAGSTVAFRAMSNSATALRVSVYFYGLPARPDAVRVGSYVDAFGVNVTNRIGTAITAGTTSEGTFTQLGSATTKPYWWWQMGFNINNTNMNAATTHADIASGTATNRRLLIENQIWQSTTAEQIGCVPAIISAYKEVATGDLIYGRAQTTATTTGTTMIAYGLGG